MQHFPVYFHWDPCWSGSSNLVTTITWRPPHNSVFCNALPIIIFRVLTNSAPRLTTDLFIAQLASFFGLFFFLREQRENGCFVERVSRGFICCFQNVIWIFRLSMLFSFSRQSHRAVSVVLFRLMFFLRCVSAYRLHFSWLFGLHVKELSVTQLPHIPRLDAAASQVSQRSHTNSEPHNSASHSGFC